MSNIVSKNIKHSLIVLFITLLIPAALLLAILIKIAYAWTNPTQAPSGGSGAITVTGRNVGIGTTSPSYNLDVIGDIRLRTGPSGGASPKLLFSTPTITNPGQIQMDSSGNLSITQAPEGERVIINGWLLEGSDFRRHGGTSSRIGVDNGSITTLRLENGFGVLYKMNVEIDGGLTVGTKSGDLSVPSGNAAIGTNSSAGYKLYVNGNMFVNGTISQPSDSRLKTNIVPLTGALDRLVNLQGVYFNWVESKGGMGGKLEGKQVGFIAQEVQKVFPEVISEDSENHYLGIDYAKLVPILLEGIKELDAKNKDLEMRVERLEKKLE